MTPELLQQIREILLPDIEVVGTLRVQKSGLYSIEVTARGRAAAYHNSYAIFHYADPNPSQLMTGHAQVYLKAGDKIQFTGQIQTTWMSP